METEIIEHVNPSTLKIGENSRFRVERDLTELMESIKQNGILQPISARKEDKKIICGNRRLAAAIKLGYEKVPVRFIPNIDDKQLLILNLMENIQRKDISSIEIGKQADTLLKTTKFKMSMSELATVLGVKVSRIKTCLDAFKRMPEKFRSRVVHLDSSRDRRFGDLPEAIVFAILNYGRDYKKLSYNEINMLFETAAKNNLTVAEINLIGHLNLSGMPLHKAIKENDNYSISRCNFIVLKTELEAALKKEGVTTKSALFEKLVRRSYPNLIY